MQGQEIDEIFGENTEMQKNEKEKRKAGGKDTDTGGASGNAGDLRKAGQIVFPVGYKLSPLSSSFLTKIVDKPFFIRLQYSSRKLKRIVTNQPSPRGIISLIS
ncbi:hypothetical protein LOD99_9995 [Oopsacas minuta]|uniref:Uncharacterized protein n=1 Tax=Oopsacas minuta TaxID=111878 RepID=A0AAV7KIY4_9METZ|nr:hypothetical protein LOD99_9995 [Oopsacas minuta]